MVRESEIRAGEVSVQAPPPRDAGLVFIGFEWIEGRDVFVRGLDCLDGTPLLDLKPDRSLFTPVAPPQAGDFQVGDP